MARPDPAMLILSSPGEVRTQDRIWGTGGWMPPDQREALDWLTLARLLGWRAEICESLPLPRDGQAPPHWIIVAREPDRIDADSQAALAVWLERHPLAVIGRAGAAGSSWAKFSGAAVDGAALAGRTLAWCGPGDGERWLCRRRVDAQALSTFDDAAALVLLDGVPVVSARSVGRGSVIALGFHPSAARDATGAATACIRHILTQSALTPVAWFDLTATMVLRMDDPGGAQNVFLREWTYPKLDISDWLALGAELGRQQARLSAGYVSGWVDDGDSRRGTLSVEGKEVARVPGTVYPSPWVEYRDLLGHVPGQVHDYRGEYAGIQALRRGGLVEVELHGFTHMHPDTAAWAASPDRYDEVQWYRELGPRASDAIAKLAPTDHPLARGVAALAEHFRVRPTTLICPGEQWTNPALERALDLGLVLVGSYYLGIRDEDRFCWALHVCSPGLHEVDPAWFDSGLPVVGYFHDNDPVLKGLAWLRDCLDRWRQAGARRFIDYRELAGAICRNLSIRGEGDAWRLVVDGQKAPDLVRPVPCFARFPGQGAPESIVADCDGRKVELRAQTVGADTIRFELPVSGGI